MSVIYHRLCLCHLYLSNFFWWEMCRANMLHDIIHSYCIEKQILKTKRNLKIDSIRSHISRILQTSPLHSFFVPYQSPAFWPSLENLWSTLRPWYSEFHLVSLLVSPNPRVEKLRHSVQIRISSSTPWLLEITTPRPFAGRGCLCTQWKGIKVSYEFCVACFSRICIIWGQQLVLWWLLTPNRLYLKG
jgi:hypothetical protein